MSPAAKALFSPWPTSALGALAQQQAPAGSPTSDPELALIDATSGAAADSQNGTREAVRSTSSLEDQTRRLEWTPLNLLWAAGTLIALVALAAGPRIRDRLRS